MKVTRRSNKQNGRRRINHVKGGFLLSVPFQKLIMSYPEVGREDDTSRYLADKIYVTPDDTFVDSDYTENWKNDSMAVDDWLHAIEGTSAPYFNVIIDNDKGEKENRTATQEDYINQFIMPYQVKRVNYIPDGFTERNAARKLNNATEYNAIQAEIVKLDTSTPVKIDIVKYIINQEVSLLLELIKQFMIDKKAINDKPVIILKQSRNILEKIYKIVTQGIALKNFYVGKNVIYEAIDRTNIEFIIKLHNIIDDKILLQYLTMKPTKDIFTNILVMTTK